MKVVFPTLGGRICRGPPRRWKPARSWSDVRPARPDGCASLNTVRYRPYPTRGHGPCAGGSLWPAWPRLAPNPSLLEQRRESGRLSGTARSRRLTADDAEGLQRLDLLGLRALGPAASGVLDPLVLLQAAVAVSLNGGVVNEHVVGAVVGG